MNIQDLPSWPQSQESLASQMGFLVQVANRISLFNIADAVKQLTAQLDEARHGCHVELYEDGAELDGCVIDEGNLHDCICAKKGMRKEQCEYWRIVKPPKSKT